MDDIFEIQPVKDPMEVSSRLMSFLEGHSGHNQEILAQFDAFADPASEKMVLAGLGLESLDDYEELVTKTDGYSARRMVSGVFGQTRFEINRTWIEIDPESPIVTYSVCKRPLQAD